MLLAEICVVVRVEVVSREFVYKVLSCTAEVLTKVAMTNSMLAVSKERVGTISDAVVSDRVELAGATRACAVIKAVERESVNVEEAATWFFNVSELRNIFVLIE